MSHAPAPTEIWHNRSYPGIDLTRPQLSVNGKSILITDGGIGIGAETAYQFARAGASSIGLLGRTEKNLLDTQTKLQAEFTHIKIATGPSRVEAAVSAFASSSKLDVLVSNAGVMEIQEPITSVDADAWFDALLTNLKASFVVTQTFARYALPSATIVNISSGLAHLDVRPGASSNCTAKAAAVRFFQGLIYENPRLPVVNLHPGIIATEAAKRSGAIESQDEIDLPANFIVWLASFEARFLKGKFVWANWVVDELKGRAKEIRGTNFQDIGLTGWPFSA